MPIHLSQEFAITGSILRPVYHSARSVYRKILAIRNKFSNLIDPPIIILLYHRVADLPNDPEMLAVSPENFRAHLKFLKEHFPIVRFEEDWSDLKEKAVAITFDDGYADNVHIALPILEETGVTATFFISTGHIGTNREFWWHRLETILLQETQLPIRFMLDDVRYGQCWMTETMQQRRVVYDTLNALMQRISPERREAWLDQLQNWAGSAPLGKNLHRSMTAGEIRRLAASPQATVGAHTVTHSALAALNEVQQRREIFTSKQDLEEMTGEEIATFSYPFGRKKDYDRTSVRLCRQAGFKKTAANFPGQAHRWTDPFQIPRHLVRNWDKATFAAELEIFWTR